MKGLETWLLGRLFLYGLFHLITGDEPNRERLRVVFSEATNEALALFGLEETGDGKGKAAVEAFEAQALRFAGQPDVLVSELRDTYTRLFVGPLELKAPPWESVYRDGQRLLFTETTLAVREAYRSEGFLPAQYPQVPDDHISLELDFMHQLCIRSIEARETEDEAEYERLFKTQRDFLAEHLLQWAPRYTADLAAVAGDSLYAAIAFLLAAFLATDSNTLEELTAKS